MALTQEQIDFFWQNGYLPCGKILQDGEIEVLRREYDAVFQQARAENTYSNLSAASNESVEQKDSAAQHMLQITQMCERSITFRRLLYDSRILDIVQELIGPNIMLFHDQALFKPPHTGGPVHWHQDNAYWKCRPATLVSCWLTLDDVVRENGAMQVIPGSHLKPAWHDQSADSIHLLEIQGVDEAQAQVVDLPAGGCMLHHCQTLHYTQPNMTDRQRRAFVIHFMAPGTRSTNLDGKTMHVDFHHPMLRMSV